MRLRKKKLALVLCAVLAVLFIVIHRGTGKPSKHGRHPSTGNFDKEPVPFVGPDVVVRLPYNRFHLHGFNLGAYRTGIQCSWKITPSDAGFFEGENGCLLMGADLTQQNYIVELSMKNDLGMMRKTRVNVRVEQASSIAAQFENPEMEASRFGMTDKAVYHGETSCTLEIGSHYRSLYNLTSYYWTLIGPSPDGVTLEGIDTPLLTLKGLKEGALPHARMHIL
eukprot:Colp12_sorted_trinity150504_noHs@36308